MGYMRVLFLFFIVGIALGGCIRGIVPVEDHHTRLSFTGYSILPPEGDHWYLVARNASNVIFSKELDPKYHTFMAMTISIPVLTDFEGPEDFITWVKSSREKDSDPKRFRILEHEESLERYHGAYCSKYHMKSEDRGAKIPGSSVMIFEINGLSCMHPTAPSFLIDIGYSERYDPDKHTPIAHDSGERFLKSLEFQRLN